MFPSDPIVPLLRHAELEFVTRDVFIGKKLYVHVQQMSVCGYGAYNPRAPYASGSPTGDQTRMRSFFRLRTALRKPNACEELGAAAATHPTDTHAHTQIRAKIA